MSKITRGNIAAARAQRDILIRRGKPVPEIVEKLSRLDPDKLRPASPVQQRERDPKVPPSVPMPRSGGGEIRVNASSGRVGSRNTQARALLAAARSMRNGKPSQSVYKNAK